MSDSFNIITAQTQALAEFMAAEMDNLCDALSSFNPLDPDPTSRACNRLDLYIAIYTRVEIAKAITLVKISCVAYEY